MADKDWQIVLKRLDDVIGILAAIDWKLGLIDRNTHKSEATRLKDAMGRSFEHSRDYLDRHAYKLDDSK